MSTFLTRRAFISLTLFLFFSVILVTSILMFFKSHTPLIAMVHTGIGFILLAVAAWHLKNNFASLKTYFKLRSAKTGATFNLALPGAFLCVALTLGFALTQSAPFLTLYEWGNKLRTGEKSAEQIQFSYLRVDNTKTDATGNKLVIDLRKGPYFRWPQYAIWLETMDGKFIQPLYITQKLAQNKFVNKVTLRDQHQVFNTDISSYDDQTWDKTFVSESSPETTSQRTRPESLPVFLHQLDSQTNRNLFAPANSSDNSSNKRRAIDGFSGATILDNFYYPPAAINPCQINIGFDLRLTNHSTSINFIPVTDFQMILFIPEMVTAGNPQSFMKPLSTHIQRNNIIQ